MRRHFSYPINGAFVGMSVESFLLKQGYSRHLLINLKKSTTGLTVSGNHVYVTYRLQEGDVLVVELPLGEESSGIVATPMELTIVYEDDDLVVLNKGSGLPIHPSQGNYDNTLANGIAWYFKEQGLPFVYRVINRLDRDTTGLLILAKHGLSACILSHMIRTHQIHRTYLAAVDGDIRNLAVSGTIDAPIARVCGSTIERMVNEELGDPARTHFSFHSYKDAIHSSLVTLRLETGRTHQIRVHMKHAGFPLYGDFLYNPDYRYIQRQSLHSWKLDFLHPITKEPLTFTAAVPEDMHIFL